MILTGEDALFPYGAYPPSWSADDLVWEYGAPVSALAIVDNQLRLDVVPSRAGLAAEVMLEQHGVTAYDLDAQAVTAKMTGWEIEQGQWEMVQSAQADENDALSGSSRRTENFERSSSLDVTFPPRTTTVPELKLKEKGVPYWSRPYLGLDPGGVLVEGRRVKVTVHSVGAVDAPARRVEVRDRAGRTLASAATPALKAPTDPQPKTATVMLNLRARDEPAGGTLTVKPGGIVPEITMMNNTVTIDGRAK